MGRVEVDRTNLSFLQPLRWRHRGCSAKLNECTVFRGVGSTTDWVFWGVRERIDPELLRVEAPLILNEQGKGRSQLQKQEPVRRRSACFSPHPPSQKHAMGRAPA